VPELTEGITVKIFGDKGYIKEYTVINFNSMMRVPGLTHI
jgi:hypothetical protein